MTSQHSTVLSGPHLNSTFIYRSHSRRVSRRSRHGLYAASQQQQQQLVATEDSIPRPQSLLASSTASPWCVILPNGKQFQLRELCTRHGRQSVWGCEAAALLSTAEPVLVDQHPGDDNLPTHTSQPPQQHTTGSLPALQHQEEQQAAQQHPWSQQWQDAFQQEQQQLRPLSAYHMKRLRWQQQQLHQQVMMQQQQQQQQQQAHLQQELEDFSQRAASLHQPIRAAADHHVMLQPLVPGHEAAAAEAAARPAAADAIKQLHLSPAQVLGPWAAADLAVEGTAADADAAVKDSRYTQRLFDTLPGSVPAAPAALLWQPQSTEQAIDAGDAALGLNPGSAATRAPAAAATVAEAPATSARDTSAAAGAKAAGGEGLDSAAGGRQDDALTPPGLFASTLQLPLTVRDEDMLAWSLAEVETAGAAAAAATAGLSAPAAADAAREQVHDSAAAPGTGQPGAAAGVPSLPTAQAAATAAADDPLAAVEAAAVEFQALFTEQLQHHLELQSSPSRPAAAAAAALGAEAAAEGAATTAAGAALQPATSGAADMLSCSLSEAASTTEPVPAANSITFQADPVAVTADGQAAAQSPGTLVSTQQQQPAAAAGVAGQPLAVEQRLGVQSVLLKDQQQQQQQQGVEQCPAEAQQHTSTVDVATSSVLQASVVQLRPAASEPQLQQHQQQHQPKQQQPQQQQQGTEGQACPAVSGVSSGALKLLRQIDQSRTCWELGLLVMHHTSYAPGLNSSKALHVNLEDWTPDVVAAALDRLRKLAPYTLVAHLRNKEARQQQHQLRQHHPAPLGSLQGDLSSPGSSSSSSRRQDGHHGDDTEVQPHFTSSQHIKTLMRVLLRLMDMLELQLTEVPSRALREAAVCSANLLGRSCTQSTWWRRARGYMVLGEAALRLKEGRMPVSHAIQVCYSYSHCDYPPTQLLQVIMQQVQDRPGVLEQQTLTTLCRFTYCVTRHRPQLTGFDQGALTAAVLQALPLQNLAAAGLVESVEAMTGRMFDLVMLLRHLCQLNFKPPAGVLGLMPALMTGMASMTMQELCTVLHVAVAWDLPQKQELAAAAAEAAMSAAGLQQQPTQQQQQQPQSGAATGGRLHPASSGTQVAGTTQEPSGPVARTVADAVLLLHRLCCLGYHPPQLLTQHLLGFIGPKLHELSLLQAELLRRALVHIWRSPAYCQQLVQACFTQWLSPQQHVSTSSTMTHYGSSSGSSGSSSSHGIAGAHDAKLAQQAHAGADTAEQQYVLQPALLRLPHWQLKALLVAAGRFGLLASEVREQQQHEDWQLQEQLHQQQEQQQQQEQEQQAGHGALRQQLQEALSGSLVPQQEHEAMITAAQPAQQMPATGSALQAVGCASSLSTPRTGLEHSCEPVDNSCHSMAAAFISTVLSELTPAVLAEWRADLVLALLWSAARLKLQVSQELLQAGTAVMRAGLRQQIAARELVLLLWTAATLKMNDPGFLEGLCGCLAHCANQLAPSSIASAAWALVELRCPHSVLLGVLSRELLRPSPWLSSHQAFKIRKWHRRTPSRQVQQQRLQQLLLPWAVQQEAAAAFNSRYSDAAAWGSLQRPMPRSKGQASQQKQPAAAGAKRRPPRRGRQRAARRNSAASSVGYQPSSPRSLSLSPAATGVLGYVHEQHLLDVHPRVRQLGTADVAKLVCSCCRAGWAPPHLFAVLAARLVELMPQMDPATLVQVMWAYSTAGCCDGSLLQAAARRAASLGSRQAFSSSRQLLSLLASFRAMGLLNSEAQAVLQELERLQVSESLQAVQG